jgi:hypothetical protein
MYSVQIRDERGRWKAPRIDPDHHTLEAAIERVTKCDPDGFFMPDARVVGPKGFMYTFNDWHEANLKKAKETSNAQD